MAEPSYNNSFIHSSSKIFENLFPIEHNAMLIQSMANLFDKLGKIFAKVLTKTRKLSKKKNGIKINSDFLGFPPLILSETRIHIFIYPFSIPSFKSYRLDDLFPLRVWRWNGECGEGNGGFERN